MKLELKHLAPYLPYGLKIIYGGEIREMVCNPLPTQAKPYVNICVLVGQKLAKPLLLPLSEIKQFMPEILKSLSKLDLSGCTFDENEYEEDITQWWCNAFDGDRVIACLTFDGNAFYIQYWHGTADDTFDIYEPQYEALRELAKYHLDYQYLIEQGLALNKNDYPNA